MRVIYESRVTFRCMLVDILSFRQYRSRKLKDVVLGLLCAKLGQASVGDNVWDYPICE